MACQHIIVQSIIENYEITVETPNCDNNIIVNPTIQTQEIVIETVDGVLGSVKANTFETVSKNLNAYPSKPTYVNGMLQVVTYDLGNSLNIFKTLNWNLNKQLVNITLSGHLPSGIKTSKLLTYDTLGYLSSVDYA